MIPVVLPGASWSTHFVRVSASKLKDDYLVRLSTAVEAFPDHALWERSGQNMNAVGNILLHMSGNLRQWVISGVGSRPDDRNRANEFAARSGADKRALLQLVAETVEEACDVLRTADEGLLRGVRRIQIYDVTGYEAIYHAVEHFSYHLGQVIFIVKQTTGRDLRFYTL